MSKILNVRFFMIFVLQLALFFLVAAPVWSEQTRAGDTSHRFGDKKAAYKSAIEKTGFYVGIVNERVTILNEKSYKKLTYMVGKNMIVTYQDQEIEIEWQSLLPHSIVKLIIVDAEVVEIVLIQESS